MSYASFAALLVPLCTALLRGEEPTLPAAAGKPDFARDVAPMLKRYCTACHNSEEREGELVLETFDDVLRGDEDGAVVVPGKSGESRLWLVLTGKSEIRMPPKNRRRPTDTEVEALRAWIDAGAPRPADGTRSEAAALPRIVPRTPPRLPVQALAFSPQGDVIALGRQDAVEVVSLTEGSLPSRVGSVPGAVNALAFSPDGGLLTAAGGEAGVRGLARVWRRDGERFSPAADLWGHADSLYALAIDPTGSVAATGGYDQAVRLWDLSSGRELRVLQGHNGAVFDLSFRADGKVLASASADRTVKLWEVASGRRLDTFSQSLKDLHTLAFSPDGKRLAAGGKDNRIRVFAVSAGGEEGTNPILVSRFAHEGAILGLEYSADGRQLLSAADDRTVKLWDAATLSERFLVDRQPDWPGAVAFAPDGKAFAVGRLDGSVDLYSTADGARLRSLPAPRERTSWRPARSQSELLVASAFALAAAPAILALQDADAAQPTEAKPPVLKAVEPRGIERGRPARVRLQGERLDTLREVKLSHPGLAASLLEEPRAAAGEAWIELCAAADLPRGRYRLKGVSPAGESAEVDLFVDDVPQVVEVEPNDEAARASRGKLPAAFWGLIERRGDLDHFAVEAHSGETLVLDLEARSLGSSLDGVVSLFDAAGRLLQSEAGSDSELDPLVVHQVDRDGVLVVRVYDRTANGSEKHHYRLSAGSFPFVTSSYPPSVPAGAATRVELRGHNLPAGASAVVPASALGDAEVPLAATGFRSRGSLRVLVTASPDVLEAEPNDSAEHATPVAVPGAACGRIEPAAAQAEDLDHFRFESRAGQTWVIETEAARRGSPLDTRIEVLHADGRPVDRVVLGAVRDSAIAFRGIDSDTRDVRVENWEEMELNQYLYFQGEVTKIFRMPQGPDSGFVLYEANGRRRCYFDTSACAHANEEACYVVEAHAPGTQLVPNGLPVFTLSFANDDDGERRFGRDSKLTFSAPADGSYVVRVRDVNGRGGDRFTYRLVVRESRPDFRPSLQGSNPVVPAGNGRSFTVVVDREDGFEGPVEVSIGGLPPGFHATQPLVVESGHRAASGTLWAAPDAPAPAKENEATSQLTARAVVAGAAVEKPAGSFGRIQLGPAPKLRVFLEPHREGGGAGEGEIRIEPGRSVPALLRVERSGYDDLVTFSVENLPHGVIVDNIGLNGVLLPKSQTTRQIFLTCAAWVPETERFCHALANQEGSPASPPVLLRVVRPGETEAIPAAPR